VNEFRRNKPWDAKEFEEDGKIFEEKNGSGDNFGGLKWVVIFP
ncbi:uncharacterized protein METZ01_LOCUS366462, partial [marine metagenome]